MEAKKFPVVKAIAIGAGAAVAAAAAFGAVMYRQFRKDVKAGAEDEFCSCGCDEHEGETEINEASYACVETLEQAKEAAEEVVEEATETVCDCCEAIEEKVEEKLEEFEDKLEG